MTVEKHIEEIHTKVDKLTDSFNKFKLDVSIDVALLKQKTKSNAAKYGILSGAIISVLIGVAKKFLM